MTERLTLPDKIEIAQATVEGIVNQFINLRLPGRTQPLRCPYWMNFNPVLKASGKEDLYRGVAGGGKMSPDNVVNGIVDSAGRANLNLAVCQNAEIVDLCVTNAIGVDCSGFAYQCLWAVYSSFGSKDFTDKVVSLEGKTGISKVGVKDLQSNLVSDNVPTTENILPCDLIFKGSHVFVVVSHQDEKIVCANSSNVYLPLGVCCFDIMITKPNQDIFSQDWMVSADVSMYASETLRKLGLSEEQIARLERLRSGRSIIGFSDYLIFAPPKPEDGVRRLKVIDELYHE